MPRAPKQAFYAVQRGRRSGIYASWSEASAQVQGFPQAKHKKFATREDAERFLCGDSSISVGVVKPTVPTTSTTPVSLSSQTAIRQIWTDGACRGNGQAGARAGIGVYFDGQAPDLSERLPGPLQTNQRAELYAILRALQEDPLPSAPCTIVTDSAYAISCLTQWHHSWQANGWKNGRGDAVVNADVIRHCLTLLAKRQCPPNFRHVRSHQVNGEVGNARADTLAVAGAQKPSIAKVPPWDDAAAVPTSVAVGVDAADLEGLLLSAEELASIEVDL